VEEPYDRATWDEVFLVEILKSGGAATAALLHGRDSLDEDVAEWWMADACARGLVTRRNDTVSLTAAGHDAAERALLRDRVNVGLPARRRLIPRLLDLFRRAG
jgi:hypothetical protein